MWFLCCSPFYFKCFECHWHLVTESDPSITVSSLQAAKSKQNKFPLIFSISRFVFFRKHAASSLCLVISAEIPFTHYFTALQIRFRFLRAINELFLVLSSVCGFIQLNGYSFCLRKRKMELYKFYYICFYILNWMVGMHGKPTRAKRRDKCAATAHFMWCKRCARIVQCAGCTANKSRAMHLNRIWISHTQTQIVHFFLPFLFFSLFSSASAYLHLDVSSSAYKDGVSFSLSPTQSFEAVLSRNGKNKWQKGNTTNVNNRCRWNWRESTRASGMRANMYACSLEIEFSMVHIIMKRVKIEKYYLFHLPILNCKLSEL